MFSNSGFHNKKFFFNRYFENQWKLPIFKKFNTNYLRLKNLKWFLAVEFNEAYKLRVKCWISEIIFNASYVNNYFLRGLTRRLNRWFLYPSICPYIWKRLGYWSKWWFYILNFCMSKWKNTFSVSFYARAKRQNMKMGWLCFLKKFSNIFDASIFFWFKKLIVRYRQQWKKIYLDKGVLKYRLPKTKYSRQGRSRFKKLRKSLNRRKWFQYEMRFYNLMRKNHFVIKRRQRKKNYEYSKIKSHFKYYLYFRKNLAHFYNKFIIKKFWTFIKMGSSEFARLRLINKLEQHPLIQIKRAFLIQSSNINVWWKCNTVLANGFKISQKTRKIPLGSILSVKFEQMRHFINNIAKWPKSKKGLMNNRIRKREFGTEYRKNLSIYLTCLYIFLIKWFLLWKNSRNMYITKSRQFWQKYISKCFKKLHYTPKPRSKLASFRNFIKRIKRIEFSKLISLMKRLIKDLWSQMVCNIMSNYSKMRFFLKFRQKFNHINYVIRQKRIQLLAFFWSNTWHRYWLWKLNLFINYNKTFHNTLFYDITQKVNSNFPIFWWVIDRKTSNFSKKFSIFKYATIDLNKFWWSILKGTKHLNISLQSYCSLVSWTNFFKNNFVIDKFFNKK